MVSRLFFTIFGCIWVCGCLYNWPSAQDLNYPCQNELDCIDGYSCVDGICVTDASGENDSDPTDVDSSDPSSTDPSDPSDVDSSDPSNPDVSDASEPNSDPSEPQEPVTPIDGTLACGRDFCCGIQSNGSLSCWGNNPGGSGTAASGISNQTTSKFVWITADDHRFCGATEDGAVECFGGGSPPDDKPANNFTQVSASANYVCGVREGTLECWGYDEPEPPGNLSDVQHIATSSYSACSLDGNGSLTCWGMNTSSPPLSSFDTISIDYQAACGIANQQLYCWGDFNPLDNSQAQEGSYVGLSVAEQTVGDFDEGRSVCAITLAGAVSCSCCKTGAFHEDDCRPDSNMDICKFQPNTTEQFIHVAVGDNYGCAMRTDGAVTCWGRGTTDGFGGPHEMDGVNAPVDITFKTTRD